MADSTTLVERSVAIGVGALLLLIAASLGGWAAHVAVAALRLPSGWPPELARLLGPVMLTVAAVGFGAWRILRLGLPPRLAGLSLGRAVLAVLALAAIAGALS